MAETVTLAELRLATAGLASDVSAAKSHLEQLNQSHAQTLQQAQSLNGGLQELWHGIRDLYIVREAVRGFEEFVHVMEDAERSTFQLSAALDATGHASGMTLQQIKEFAQELQGKSLFKAEEIEHAAAVLTTFRAVSGPAFKEVLQDAVNMSSLFGGDLQQSIRVLGRAFDDPIHGLMMLHRVGVDFTQGEKDRIQTLVASGKLMDAQAVIQEHLNKTMADGAASTKGVEGDIKHVTDAFREMTVAIGESQGTFEKWLKSETDGLSGLALLIQQTVIGKPDEQRLAEGRDALIPALKKSGMQPAAHGGYGGVSMLQMDEFAHSHEAEIRKSLSQTREEYTSMIASLDQLAEAEQRVLTAKSSEGYKAGEADAAGRAARDKAAADAAYGALVEQRKKAADEAKKVTDAIQALREENLKVTQGADAMLAYKLQMMGASQEQIKLALSIQDGTAAFTKATDASKRYQEQVVQNTHVVAEFLAKQREQVNQLQYGVSDDGGLGKAMQSAAGDPKAQDQIRAYAQQIQDLKNLAAGHKAIDEATKKQEETEQREAELYEHALKKISDSFAETFDKLLTGRIKSFRDFAKDILDTWSQTMAQLAAASATAHLFGGSGGASSGAGAAGGLIGQILAHILGVGPSISSEDMSRTVTNSWADISTHSYGAVGNGIPALEMHSGGVVGAGVGAMRSMTAAMLASAPRFHSGLGADEFPAILQKGERVIPKGQGGGMTVVQNHHWNITAMDSRSVTDMLETHKGVIGGIVADAVRNSRSLGRVMAAHA